MNALHASTSNSPATGVRCFAGRAIVVAMLAVLGGTHSAPAGELLDRARQGPLKDQREIVFAVRGVVEDGHWYANFGHYAPERLCRKPLYPIGSSLRAFDLATGTTRVLLDDPQGGIRDPQVHYEGHKILFAYRPGGTEHYHLHEINADGSGLRQLTDGPFDDIEPVYLPNDDIVFGSSRCNRWVGCWLTPVATLHRCNRDGGGIRLISMNIEHDNTPWPLPDGRLLYTRWEYVDRSQVHYHHLWTMNPDGTAPMTYFGNLKPGLVMIDAKPVPNSERVIAVFSPGHGQKEHAGPLALVDPKTGPDEDSAVRMINKNPGFRDPWAFSEQWFIAARGNAIFLLDEAGHEEILYQLDATESKAGRWCHEPRPLAPRLREAVLADRAQPTMATGTMLLMDTRLGRNMAGVGKEEIKQLLVLETLPKPINFTGGMEPLSYGGTFTLERVLGTVPVEADGSAYFEVPALRSVFFVALDGAGRAVKRMQSFTGVQPGESLSCIGCHESRSSAPPQVGQPTPLAANRAPSPIEPYPDVPEVFDFPRDIQPILDQHCIECHQVNRAEGGVILSGDHGPLYSHGYFSLTAAGQLADGRNRAESNFPPHQLGSGAAPLMKKLTGGHHDVKTTAREQLLVRLWLDSGAPYPGTYAALGTGMIGGNENNEQVIEVDHNWPTTRAAAAAIDRRCATCHQNGGHPLPRTLSDDAGFKPWLPDSKGRRIQRNRHIVFNLTNPEQSLMVLAPLAKAAGGHGTCREPDRPAGEGGIFTATTDPDYQAILGMCAAGQRRLAEIKRFDMPGFRPRAEWISEMKRCGILPPTFDATRDPLDCYAIDRAYWQSFFYQPPTLAQP